MNIGLIRQKDPYGCALACLAMVTGKAYEEVRAAFVGHDFGVSTRELRTGGISYVAVDGYLSDHGYAVRRLARYDPVLNLHRDPWPVEPFAPVHVCEVITSMGHSVVMLADGTVLDPNREEPGRLSDYAAVNYVAGVYPAGVKGVVDAEGFHAVLEELKGLSEGRGDGLLRFYIKQAADVAKNMEHAEAAR